MHQLLFCTASLFALVTMLLRFSRVIYIFMTRVYIYIFGGPGSSVGIATDYGLDGPVSNPGGDEIFRPSRLALGPTQPPVKWVLGLSRGYSAAGACC